MGWDPAKSKQSEGLWVALIQSSAVGYHPINHCLLDAFATSRSAEWWRNTDELMACWAQASPVPVMWSWDRPLLPNCKPSSRLQTNFASPGGPSGDLPDCLNEGSYVWALTPCHCLVEKTKRQRRTKATSVKLMRPFQFGPPEPCLTSIDTVYLRSPWWIHHNRPFFSLSPLWRGEVTHWGVLSQRYWSTSDFNSPTHIAKPQLHMNGIWWKEKQTSDHNLLLILL